MRRASPTVDTHTSEYKRLLASARTQALPDALFTNPLDDACALAWTFLRPLCCQRGSCARADGRMLEAPRRCVAASTVFCPALRKCARCAPSHSLRSGDSGTCIHLACGLAGGSAAHALDPVVGNSALPGVHASAAGAVHSIDTHSAFGDCDGGRSFPDLAHLARRNPARLGERRGNIIEYANIDGRLSLLSE